MGKVKTKLTVESQVWGGKSCFSSREELSTTVCVHVVKNLMVVFKSKPGPFEAVGLAVNRSSFQIP